MEQNNIPGYYHLLEALNKRATESDEDNDSENEDRKMPAICTLEDDEDTLMRATELNDVFNNLKNTDDSNDNDTGANDSESVEDFEVRTCDDGVTPSEIDDRDRDHEIAIIRCSPRLNRGNTEMRIADHGRKYLDGQLRISAELAFNLFQELNDHVVCYAKQEGFRVKMSNTYYDEEDGSKGRSMIEKRFPIGQYDKAVAKRGANRTLPRHVTGFVCRGKFQCAAKGCSWLFHFAHRQARGPGDKFHYVIKSEGLNLLHSNHHFTAVSVGNCPQNYDLVDRQKDLTEEELLYLQDRAKIGLGKDVAKVKIEMARKFFNRNYKSDLLRRVLVKYSEEYFGKGHDKIPALVRMGECERERGGAFRVYIDDACQLRGFIFQIKEMREYASTYNDFVILDGTHGTNKYGLILEPATVVDCLGMSVICGIPIFGSEQSAFSRDILVELGLQNESGTIMTDEGSAFHSIAEKLNMKHLLCSFHFQQKANKSGFDDDLKTAFDSLIYNDFVTPEKFDIAFESVGKSIDDNYPNAAGARKYLASLYKLRAKVCFTFTKDVFSCGQRASSRAESINSSIKGRGQLKKEMKSFGLFELVEYILQLFRGIEAAKLQKIIKCIRDKETISPYVKKKWCRSVECAGSLSDAVMDEASSDHDRQVWNVRISDDYVSVVHVHSDGAPPTCTCGYYRSTKLPCRCICYVTTKCPGKKYYMPADLHPRWQLKNHPLWRVAHASLRITLPCTESNTTATLAAALPCTESNTTATLAAALSTLTTDTTSDYIVPNEIFNDIEDPALEDRRYAQLNMAFQAVAVYAKEDPVTFKRIMAILTMEHEIAAGGKLVQDKGERHGKGLVLAPPSRLQKKRASITQEDVRNRSRCNVSKRKKKK